MRVIGKADKSLPDDFVIRMTVEFGPGLCRSNITRREFIQALRTAAKKRPDHFLGQMYAHYADHIEAVAERYPDGEYALDAPANTRQILNTYYGEGSCSGCTNPDPGGSCCKCVHDGIESCEPCTG